MAPPDMPTAMSGGAIDGYIVAEPFNAAGETLAGGSIIRFTGDAFKNHPCCVATMHEADIEANPDWAQRVLNGLVKAQKWAAQNREEAARIMSKDGENYLPFDQEIIRHAMLKYDLETYGASGGTGAIQHPDWDVRRIGFNPYPYESNTRAVVDLLKNTRVEGDAAFLGHLEPETVVQDLFNYDMVKQAIAGAGGMVGFDGVDPAHEFEREEVISF
jgi:NitT/TauT family transport system substrate-binding protein